MAHYVIGDLQGCYDELQDLLALVQYDHRRDRLWFCGDLVNRGPKSLHCLHFVMHCPGAETVLGNHDLHLVAAASGIRREQPGDTCGAILQDPRCAAYIDWLRARPLLLHEERRGFCLAHAGIHPHWSLAEAARLAREVSEVLRGAHYASFLRSLYREQGEQAISWSRALPAPTRLRFAVAVLTRMRFLKANGELIEHNTASPERANTDNIPWYRFPGRASAGHKVLFGHWSTVALGGGEDFAAHQVYPLDMGCVWGRRLAALRLEDEQLFSVPSRQKQRQKPEAEPGADKPGTEVTGSRPAGRPGD